MRGSMRSCDWHVSWLAGENPDIAIIRRENISEGRVARRNVRVHLKEEGTSGKVPHGCQ
jgi:hypothetical protein